MEIVAAVSISPSGMRLAGKYGLGVISVASYSEEGLQALPTQWGWAESYAQEFGTAVSRDRWRVMMPFHIAEDRQTAFEDIYDGLLALAQRLQRGDAGDLAPNTSTDASGLPTRWSTGRRDRRHP
jgi:alkanesulfonate monooxygenase SsuD/methylene tetrahydromethanopterin reductase-like flavin-dependent oxidoreductase (luciferase family)